MTIGLGLFYAGLVRSEEQPEHVHDVHRGARRRDDHVVAGRATRSPSATAASSSANFDYVAAEGRRLRAGTGVAERPAPRLLRLPGELLHHHRGADLGRGGRADALPALPRRSSRSGRSPSTRSWPTGSWAAASSPENGTLDFAGGVPVEMGSGFSALAAALVVGRRMDYGRRAPLLPHNTPSSCCSGAGLLWFGWFGFNGGSGIGTGQNSVLAFTNTLLTPGRARLVTWFVLDLIRGQAGHGGRRGHGDHRRLRRHHAGGRLHQPGLGDGARRARRAPELRCDHVAAAHARGRDARRARRARHGGLHRHPVHRLRRAGGLERRSRRRASSTASRRCSATRRSRRSSHRCTRSAARSSCSS